MNNDEKIREIHKAFSILDRKSAGVLDMKLLSNIPMYPIMFFQEYMEGFYMDVTPSENGGNINSGIITDGNFFTFKNIKYKDVRGYVKFDPRNLVRCDMGAFGGKDTSKVAITNIYATSDFKTFELLNNDPRKFSVAGRGKVGNILSGSETTDRFTDKALAAMSVCTHIDSCKEYFDTIEVSTSNTRVVFPTTPEGSRDILKMRDVPEGKRRRESIINWVSEHVRSINGDDHKVKKHLRGKESFTWLGYNISVTKNL